MTYYFKITILIINFMDIELYNYRSRVKYNTHDFYDKFTQF